MNYEEKLEKIRSLTESDFRKRVLIPLFSSMECRGIIEYHGSAERGKDLIFYTLDKFGEREYTAVIVKTGKIHGSLGKANSIAHIVQTQVKQALNEPYIDVYEMRPLFVHKCRVITSGEIVPLCVEHLYESLKKDELHRALKIYDGKWVVEQINRYMKTYFEENDKDKRLKEQEKQISEFNENKDKAVKLIYSLGRQYETPDYVLESNASAIMSTTCEMDLTSVVGLNASSSFEDYSDKPIMREQIVSKFQKEGIIKLMINCPYCGVENIIDPKKLFIVCKSCGRLLA